jgi:uncharacterized membrane protein
VTRRDSAKAMAALALAASFTPTLVRRRRSDQLLVSLASAGMGAAAGAATEWGVVRLAARVEGEETARALLVAAGAVATVAELPRSPSNAVALAGTAARVAGIAALVGAVAPVREVRRPVLDAAGLALAAGAGACSYVAWKRSRRTGGVQLDHYPAERWLPTVSGGEGSLVPRDDLDFEGTRFLGTAVPGLAQDPIRVFVGVGSAPTVQERCDLAVRELERLGAFERRRVVVWSATLRGYVNPVPVAAEEHLSGGDVASVVVQYHDRRTLLMPLKVPIAARTHLELLRRLPRGRAEVVVYGESLGAWASQNVFRGEGLRALDALGVSRALWVGTPYFSKLRRTLAKARDPRVAFVEAKELPPSLPPFVFLERTSDPVVIFSGLSLIWRRPAWLPERLRRQWQPGITFLGLVADLFNATNRIGAVPQALAHDYRVELPAGVNAAFGHGAPDDEVGRLADTLVAREIERGARLRAIRRGESLVSSTP